MSRYGTLTLDDGAVLRNCKSQYYAGGAVGLFAGTSEFVMNGAARMEDNEADYGGGVYVANILAAFTMNGGTIANNTATKYGGVYCEPESSMAPKTPQRSTSTAALLPATPPESPAAVCTSVV